MIVLIVLGLLFTAFFGMRVFHAFKKFDGHRPPPPGKPGRVETDVELIRGWMTVPFIAELYQVPEPALFDALKIPPQENRDKSLRDLNREYYPDTESFVLETVKATVKKLQPPPTPTSTP